MTSAKERIALVIGNTDYKHVPELPNAINDATDMEKTLKKVKFKVTLALDLNRQEMLDKITEFSRKLDPNTVGLFYYAGHASEEGGKHYLRPIDAGINRFDEVQDKSISLDRILNKMRHSTYNNLNIIILDACRNNLYKKVEPFQSVSAFAKMTAPENFLIISATTPGKKAVDGRGKNGLFTKHFIKHMLLPNKDIRTILPMVRKEVIKESKALGYKQVPWNSDSLIDDFCFVSCPSKTGNNNPPGPAPTAPVSPRKPAFEQPSFLFEPEMVLVPEGVFMMGCDREDCDKDEQPVHPVAIDSFYLGIYTITFKQWDACVKAKACPHKDDNGWGRGQRPVTSINWQDTQKFIQWLNKITKKHYRLPTEAEWEYAARRNTTTIYPWGDTIGIKNANCDGCGTNWDNKGTVPVNSFPPYQGLYNMSGNVWEWVQECYHQNYKGAPGNGSAWNIKCDKNNQNKISGVLRGGSWYSNPEDLRLTHRLPTDHERARNTYGFRIALSP